MLEPLVQARALEQAAKSTAMVVGAGALGVGAYVAWWTTDAIFGWMDKAKDKITAAKQTIKEYDESNDTNYEDLAKGTSPLGRILWSIL